MCLLCFQMHSSAWRPTEHLPQATSSSLPPAAHPASLVWFLRFNSGLAFPSPDTFLSFLTPDSGYCVLGRQILFMLCHFWCHQEGNHGSSIYTSRVGQPPAQGREQGLVGQLMILQLCGSERLFYLWASVSLSVTNYKREVDYIALHPFEL